MTSRIYKWGFWFRLKSGKGLRIALDVGPFKGIRLFSERSGYRKVHRFGIFVFEVLKPITE